MKTTLPARRRERLPPPWPGRLNLRCGLRSRLTQERVFTQVNWISVIRRVLAQRWIANKTTATVATASTVNPT